MAFSFSSAINNIVNGLTNNASDVVTCFNDVKAVLNNGITGTDHLSASANITGSQLSPTAAIAATQMAKGITFTGKATIATSETRNNVAYGTLTTPDQVTGVVLPTDGLIAMWYQATWQESVAAAARAAFFIGANQLQIANVEGGPTSAEAQHTQGATDKAIASYPLGLRCESATTAFGPYTGNVTTGQAVGLYKTGTYEVGGPVWAFAAAGTYTISVQYRATAGTVTAKNRALKVAALSF